MARKAHNTITEALMLVGGGVIGAGVALLLAPQSGRKTRSEIARFGKTIGRKGDKAVREFADNVVDMVYTVGEKAADILKSGRELTREGKRGIMTAIERGQESLGSQRRRLARMMG